MTTRRRSIVCGAIVVLLGGFGFSKPAVACRCKEPSPRVAYHLADGAAFGSVESQKESGDVTVSIIVVDRAWKQSIPRRIRVVSAKPCGFPFETGERYLVFLTEGTADSFGTRRCRGNVPASKATATLRWLRAYGKQADLR